MSDIMWQDILKADITTRVDLVNYDEEALTEESDVEWSYDIKEVDGGIQLQIKVHSFTNNSGMKELWNDNFHMLDLQSWDRVSMSYSPYHIELDKGKYKIIFRD